MFIAFDGVDGSGKTTAAQMAFETLSTKYPELNFELNRHPGATALGAEIRKLVKSTKQKPEKLSERLLFFSDWIQFCEEKLKPGLAAGKIMLNDRCTPVTDVMYGLANDVKIDWFSRLYSLYAIPRVDLLILLQISPHASLERRAKRFSEGYGEHQRCRIEELEGGEFLKRVSAFYDSVVAHGMPHNYPHVVNYSLTDFVRQFCNTIVRISGESSPAETNHAIISELESLLRAKNLI